jgi:hypothetical protein
MFNSTTKLIALSLVFAALTGCGYTINNYGASVDNVEALKALKQANTQVSVNSFSASHGDHKSIMCRAAGPIETPNKQSFEKYIEEALVAELKLAGLYSPGADIKLDGRVDKLDFNSNIGAGSWAFELTASSSNGKSMTVKSRHEFSTNWVADKACQQVAQAFSPAVQALISDLVKSPEFATLLQDKVVAKAQ